MIYISDTDPEAAEKMEIGGKARNLFWLKKMGMTVPKFLVLPERILAELCPDFSEKPVLTNDQDPIFSDQFMDELTLYFGSTLYFAVRSSASDEDGGDYSFAGQFDSYLFVSRAQLAERIEAVWRSAFSERVTAYREYNGLSSKKSISVIVQEMVDADVAGVAFGMDPRTGNQEQKIVNAVFGLGEGIVSGTLNADHFILEDSIIIREIAAKTHQVKLNPDQPGGTMLTEVEPEWQGKTTLSDAQIFLLGNTLTTLRNTFGKPQDIEFAFKNGALYLLQTRPVTSVKKENDKTGTYILWDNSNIIESYPGITSPLTFSFITTSYEEAYKLFSLYLGVGQKVVKKNARVFANTLGFLNGRVYYNLKSWYHMLALLPGYSINARFMEKMMGVKERFDLPEAQQLSKANAWWLVGKMGVQMYFRFLSLPRKRKKFQELLNATLAKYKLVNYEEKTANELMDLYLNFEKTLILEWKAPLLNDFFAMIFFGTLQKQCTLLLGSANTNIHNDLLCGSSDIISVEPIHRSIALADYISSKKALRDLFLNENENKIYEELKSGESPELHDLKNEFDRYLADFGERCVGELKLETISYTQDPTQFIRILKSYVETGFTSEQFSSQRESVIRQNAERVMEVQFQGKPFTKWKLKRILKLTRELVSARENLRYERTRAFGIVRELFTNLGKRFHKDGIILAERDIFYLTKGEIFSYIEGTSVTRNIRELIALRQKEFEIFAKLAPPSERFATYGAPYHNNDFFRMDKIENIEGGLKGIGCSPGIVRGKVRVVLNAKELSSLQGDILVTSSTDPGWVMLFPSASGIIVERGSLLSHSAIVSREMGKPCIVGVTGLLKMLKTGDEIEMDGSTGVINIFSK